MRLYAPDGSEVMVVPEQVEALKENGYTATKPDLKEESEDEAEASPKKKRIVKKKA